jgi:hypothetical protein
VLLFVVSTSQLTPHVEEEEGVDELKVDVLVWFEEPSLSSVVRMLRLPSVP